MKIGDLITIPDVKTVIELAAIRDAEYLRAGDEQLLDDIARTFVVTDDIKRNLESVLQNVAARQGRGFFLSGSFGSGKSHFLSVISLLLSYSEAWLPLVQQEPSLEAYQLDLKGRQFAVVQIPLLEHSGRERLEDIVFSAIESTLNKRWQLPVTLTESRLFVERFEKYVLPTNATEVDEFIRQQLGSEFNWQVLRKEHEDLANIIKAFLAKSEEEIPFRLTPQRGPGLDKTMNTLQQHDLRGLIILLDELSEFLKSKDSSNQLNEDARFLQFLGERSLNQPIWIVGALQEAIEKTGDIQRAVFEKIKDRYKTRLELSTRHIRELIDRRLVLKKQGADAPVREAFTILKNSFNNINITAEAFHQIYPVHPECIELLDVLSDLFSQRRGVVDFVHYQLKGDSTRHIPGMVDEDYLQLLTPDRIFDHFYIQIKENPQTNKLFGIYSNHFQKRIPEIFEESEDAGCALKTIKILILLEIAPVTIFRNVQQLANMILYRSTDLTLGDMNYEYFEENILKRLERELGYLKVEKHEGKFQDVYSFDTESTAIDLLQERLKTLKSDIRGKKREVIEYILPWLESARFPWRAILEVESHRKFIKWMNSIREGRVILSDSRTIDADSLSLISRRIGDDDDDFYIILGYPFDISEQRSAFNSMLQPQRLNRLHGGIIQLLPAPIPQNEWETLEDYFCTRVLFEELCGADKQADPDIKDKLGESLKNLERDCKRIIEDSYCAGKVFTANGEIECSVCEVTNQSFDAIVTRLVQRPLDGVFPLFNMIAPLEELSSNVVLKELLHQFIRPGVIEDINGPQFRMIRQAIENIMVPLGIAEIKGARASLGIEPKKSTGLQAILERVGQDEPVGYYELYRELRKSEFGMTILIFDLLLSVLLRKGHLVAMRENHPVAFYNLQIPLIKFVDTIGRGQLIDASQRTKLQVLTKTLIRENLTDYDIQKQEDIWEKLRDFKERAEAFLTKANQQFKSLMSKYGVDGNEALPLTFAATNGLHQLISGMNTTLDSKRGLEGWLQKIGDIDKVQGIIDRTKAVGKFLDKELFEIEQIHNYIHSPQLHIPETEGYREMRDFLSTIRSRLQINDALVLEGGLRYIRGLFSDFLDLYSNRYAQEHDLLNRAIDIEALDYLTSSDAYRFLRSFAQLTLISVQDDFPKIQKLIQNLRSRACELPVAQTLQQFPRCQCGFKLGAQIESIDFKKLKTMVQEGVRQYLAALQESIYRSQIEDYLNKMEMVRQTVPQREIKTLLELESDSQIAVLERELNTNLAQEVIEHLNKAISGDVVIVTRLIDELYENLVDRKYTKGKVRQIFESWMEGKERIGEGVYLEIISKQEANERDNKD
ncbi:hypothetical protein JXJ21_07080 [candidate division KSB1 bacterium]|nr:hypothetical protein [candidate division KSB1 bacterium]